MPNVNIIKLPTRKIALASFFRKKSEWLSNKRLANWWNQNLAGNKLKHNTQVAEHNQMSSIAKKHVIVVTSLFGITKL